MWRCRRDRNNSSTGCARDKWFESGDRGDGDGMFRIKEENVEKSVGAASEDGSPTAKVETTETVRARRLRRKPTISSSHLTSCETLLFFSSLPGLVSSQRRGGRGSWEQLS